MNSKRKELMGKLKEIERKLIQTKGSKIPLLREYARIQGELRKSGKINE